MTSISQIIPNYSTGGISDQPDELKKPGQLRDCQNAYPDLVHGLYRRPGFEQLGTLRKGCGEDVRVDQEGTWFPYVRQEATSGVQENFLFNINKSGEVRAYDIDGNILKVVYTDKALTPKDVNEIVEFGVDFNDYNECESAEYLKHDEDDALRSVAINDLIVVANPEDFTSMNSVRDNDAAAPYEAFIDVRQLVYDREYKLGFEEINSSLNPSGINYTTVTGLNLDDTDKFKIEANRTGDCPLIVNSQLTVDHTYLAPGSTNNNNPTGLKIEIETKGSQRLVKKGTAYECRYTHHIRLLDGGEGWKKGDRIRIYHHVGATPQFSATQRPDNQGGNTDPYYQIEITDVQKVVEPNTYVGKTTLSSTASGSLSSSTPGNIRDLLEDLRTNMLATTSGSPNTPFLDSNIIVIGNGLYIRHPNPFTVVTPSPDLMNVISATEEQEDHPYPIVSNVSELPLQCRGGFVAKVANTFSDQDDYWVKFKTNHGRLVKTTVTSGVTKTEESSAGYWEEVAEPGGEVRLNTSTMPHVILYAVDSSTNKPGFIVSGLRWPKRTCGNDSLNPSFAGNPISNVLFYRNRLVFLSEENVVMSRAGDLFNFFPTTAIAVSPADPIDLSVSTNYTSVLKEGIVINNGMVLFSKYQQFVLSTANDILSPSTAKIAEVSRFEFDTASRPFSLGSNIGFMGLSTTHSSLFELTNVFSEGPVDVIERSKIVSKSIFRNLDYQIYS